MILQKILKNLIQCEFYLEQQDSTMPNQMLRYRIANKVPGKVSCYTPVLLFQIVWQPCDYDEDEEVLISWSAKLIWGWRRWGPGWRGWRTWPTWWASATLPKTPPMLTTTLLTRWHVWEFNIKDMLLWKWCMWLGWYIIVIEYHNVKSFSWFYASQMHTCDGWCNDVFCIQHKWT